MARLSRPSGIPQVDPEVEADSESDNNENQNENIENESMAKQIVGNENEEENETTTQNKVQVVGLEPVLSTPQKKPLQDITKQQDNSNISPVVNGVENITLVESPNKQAAKKNLPQMPTVSKQRLVISKLVLNNFKSYAGKQVIGPFHSSFSAIVGPNGSGKSNVIDSLLFVFGFRASKMRHGKISSLIHSSSAQPNLTSCSVEVHFQDVKDNDDGTTATPVPGTELIVSRRAFKNNSSKYTINEKDSNFTEVTTLLKNRGIDLDHKRFLILQGEVESISQMKAKAENENDDGLLEYLEDIIGTSDYKKGIEDAQNEVEVLNEDCVEKTNRLNIVEKELNNLEDQKNEILGYLQVENELIMKKSALLQLYRYLCNSRIELSNKVITEQQEKLTQELEQTKENKTHVDELAKEHKSKQKEFEVLKKKAQEAGKNLSKLEVEKVQIEEKKKHIETKRKKLEKSIAQASHLKTESESSLENHFEESNRLNTQLEELTAALKQESQSLEKIQDELKDKTQGFTDEIEQIQQHLEPWRAKIGAKESEVAVAQSQVDMLREQADAAGGTFQAAQTKIENIKVKGRDKKQYIKELEEKLQYTGEQIDLGEKEIQEANQGFSHMKSKLSAMRQKLSSAKESQRAVQSQNKVLQSLNKLSSSGRIEGFHGRLGGLGTIDQKYDVAISTACPALDNLVVDTVETGQHCVEYLRKNNLGRAKFILLNRLPKRDLNKIQTPENVPRLYDLINPKDEKILPAFYSVLDDTLVAKDSDQARRIAYGGKKRWRVVTLDGMLVDIAGTMSGGGTSVKSGAMKDKMSEDYSESQVQEMEDYLQKYEQKVANATKEYEKMENALKEFREEKPKIELDISKSQMELQALENELQTAQSELKEVEKEQNSSVQGIEKELAKAEKVVQQKQKELDGLKSETAEMDQKIADLQEKIMEAGGVRLRMQKSKVDSVKEQMELCNTRLSNGVMEKTKAENELKKQSKIIEKSEKEMNEGAEEFENWTTKLNEMEQRIGKMDEEVQKMNDEVTDKEEALNEMKEELEERQKQIDSVRSVEIEIRNTIEQHQKSLKEDEYSRKSYQNELDKLKLHDLKELQGIRKQQEEDGKDEDAMEEDNNELIEYSIDELNSLHKKSLKKELENLENQNSEANIDMNVLRGYKRRFNEYQERKGVLNNAVEKRDGVKKRCDDLKQKRLDEFMDGFNAISLKLKEMYQMITMGGNAELELVDSLDPFSEGIIFSVMPPKKSWRNISNLSGGEKTLSSLALVFALHHYKPTPLYVMDEIDAALDFRNVSIVATYINERTKNGQFIVISLRNNMFELAQQLVGIYKVDNMTKSIALENKSFI